MIIKAIYQICLGILQGFLTQFKDLLKETSRTKDFHMEKKPQHTI